MSLINEALKKAQRARSHSAGDLPAAPSDGPTPGTRRRSGLPAQAWIVIAAGAAVLIVLSAVITTVLVNRPSPPPLAAAPVGPKPTPPDLDAPAPLIVAPGLALPKTDGSHPTAADAVPTASAPVIAKTPSVSDSRPAIGTLAPSGTSAPPSLATPSAAPDPRIIAFVDQIKVTGIRSSGEGSKVLMNDRVYRVNDVVERILNVRLTVIAPEGLTFEDANGVTYTKNF